MIEKLYKRDQRSNKNSCRRNNARVRNQKIYYRENADDRAVVATIRKSQQETLNNINKAAIKRTRNKQK